MGAEIIAICIGTFSCLEKDMNEKSANTMSEQITLHFGTIMELRLSQAEALVHDIMPERADGYEEVCSLLSNNATARDFDRPALCMEDGTFDILYGDEFSAIDSAFSMLYDAMASLSCFCLS